MINIGYWRKSNQIHRWFVENIQGGEDNCATYYVCEEDLVELKKLCEEVLESPEKAEEILPTQSGFFFGSEEYDEFYFNDLIDTIEIVNWALEKNFDYYEYYSSW